MDRSDSLCEFVRDRGPALSRAAHRLTGHREAADDLLQSALTRTMPHWDRIADGNPEAYLRRAMYREFVSGWRRLRAAEWPVAEPVEPRRAGESESDRVERRLVVEQALARLTERQRSVVVLRFLADRSEQEAAALLGCSVGTVKSQTARTLARLRRIAPELRELAGPRPGSGARARRRPGA